MERANIRIRMSTYFRSVLLSKNLCVVRLVSGYLKRDGANGDVMVVRSTFSQPCVLGNIPEERNGRKPHHFELIQKARHGAFVRAGKWDVIVLFKACQRCGIVPRNA